MKKNIIFPIVSILFLLFSFLANPMSNSTNDILKEILPDSLHTLLKGRPMIYYSYGHYGYTWSIIAKTDSTYRIYSGDVDYMGNLHFHKISETDSFDTTKLIIHSNALLSWGFDSISSEAIKMKRVSGPYYPIYYDLSIFNSDGVNVFDSPQNVTFSGEDSINFNKKFDKLCTIMWWVSNSEIRKYIPDSIIYEICASDK